MIIEIIDDLEENDGAFFGRKLEKASESALDAKNSPLDDPLDSFLSMNYDIISRAEKKRKKSCKIDILRV